MLQAGDDDPAVAEEEIDAHEIDVKEMGEEDGVVPPGANEKQAQVSPTKVAGCRLLILGKCLVKLPWRTGETCCVQSSIHQGLVRRVGGCGCLWRHRGET